MEEQRTETAASADFQPQATPSATTGTKNPLLAMALAGFPGIGHIYNGLYLRGILFFVTVAAMMPIAGRHEPFGFVVAFVWIFNMVDAYRQATLINFGYAQDLGMVDLPERPRANQGVLLVGIILFALGAFATLEEFFEIDVDWIFELWPVALMLMGAAFIWAWFKDKKKSQESVESEMIEAEIPEIEG
jgi:hypothetical protein